MGFQIRKRTNGKKGWWNGSYSRKGVGASGSVKLSDNVTWNTGDILNGKTNQRVTVNLGNGLRYVWYGKKTKQTKSTPSQPVHCEMWPTKIGLGLMYILIMCIIIYIAGT